MLAPMSVEAMTELLWANITAEMWDDEPEVLSPYDATPINAIFKSGRASLRSARAAVAPSPQPSMALAGCSPT